VTTEKKFGELRGYIGHQIGLGSLSHKTTITSFKIGKVGNWKGVEIANFLKPACGTLVLRVFVELIPKAS
jgi:hypothetical protein